MNVIALCLNISALTLLVVWQEWHPACKNILSVGLLVCWCPPLGIWSSCSRLQKEICCTIDHHPLLHGFWATLWLILDFTAQTKILLLPIFTKKSFLQTVTATVTHHHQSSSSIFVYYIYIYIYILYIYIISILLHIHRQFQSWWQSRCSCCSWLIILTGFDSIDVVCRSKDKNLSSSQIPCEVLEQLAASRWNWMLSRDLSRTIPPFQRVVNNSSMLDPKSCGYFW